MRSTTYITLVTAALSWSAQGAILDKTLKHGSDAVHKLAAAAGSRTLSSDGSHPKNSSSVSYRQQQGIHLEIRQAGGGTCGASAGRCPNDLCCSDYGFCGDSVDHCAPLLNCQSQYGVCGWPRVVAPPPTTSTPPPPTTAAPPPTTTTTPVVVVTTAPPTISTAISSLPIPTRVVPPTSTSVPVFGTITTNGMCGNGTTCLGNPNVGPCCSQFFYCGSSLEYCGAGCHVEFGACLGVQGLPPNPGANATTVVSGGSSVVLVPTTVVSTVTVTATVAGTTPTTSARPTTTAVQLPAGQRSSTDGRCGNGVSCLGTNYGKCCSQFGWCGDGDQFCPPVVGCQPQFGECESR
ncbi:hypothetical protein QBC39DRAFT_308574 [Podospora conica]|nr:hypothetical protein QBC39DRAFT_308574 [Schizothecium conicum]